MHHFSKISAFALVVAAVLCVGARSANAQASPLSYWTPGWPLGFDSADIEQSANTYRNFPNFTANGGGFAYSRYNFSNGWFVGNSSGSYGLNGLSQSAAFSNLGSISTQGVQFGYNFKNTDMPVSVYGGFNTLNYNGVGVGNPFTSSFDNQANAASGYSAHAGVEFKPTSNVSLSLDVGVVQQPGNINALVLPGASPYGFRR